MFDNSNKIAFKIQLKQACVGILNERIDRFLGAISLAQESANNQEKSAMGDKHETSRSISQNEVEMNVTNLSQAKKDLQMLQSIQVEQLSKNIKNGSVFELSNQLFFVGVGLGTIKVGANTVYAISYLSPLFLRVKMKTAGDIVLFGNKEEKIREVF